MAPSAIVEPPVRNASTVTVTLPLDKDRERASEAASAYSSRMFKDALLEQNRVKSSSKAVDLLVSILLHITVLSIPIFLGLYFTQTINLKDFTSTLLVAPPPPPPPPAAPTKLIKVAPKRVFTQAGKLLAPTVIPKQIAMIKEEPLPPEAMGGVEGGVPGGVPGGQLGGVIGGVIGGIGTTKAPQAPTETKKIVRVGGRVRPPTVIRRVEPMYPTLARAAHVQGDVVIDAILDEQGNVTEMKVVSGPPLLYQAALEALSQWKYQPTYLNDEPVSVQFIVTISFRLNQ